MEGIGEPSRGPRVCESPPIAGDSCQTMLSGPLCASFSIHVRRAFATPQITR
ncbi:hypothetical protein RB3073 [Rhodopirellula baltica SH 1]|uniref:Uncharacterized protein n=1 Tax=Rhodopirellula baltica (strain DSM 10527 / NCIMB 13988 / SH1) TaxID=243090 RepID=Q7UUT2_RHOBA|nr:hypothetical protein RB3073 [Rhodopirellula baltica SH 1]